MNKDQHKNLMSTQWAYCKSGNFRKDFIFVNSIKDISVALKIYD